MVHKAILELWRPNPSELTLLLTKGIEATSLKASPTAYTLTGSSDPCYVEAYHLADSSDGKIDHGCFSDDFSLLLSIKLALCFDVLYVVICGGNPVLVDVHEEMKDC